MKVRRILLSLMVLCSALANAQSIDTLPTITTVDSIRYNPGFPMIDEFPRPPIYDTWLKRIVMCEGLNMPPQSEINRIRYFVVNTDPFKITGNSYWIDAAMLNRQHYMVIALPSVWDYDVIAHEFLHFVLWYQFGSLYDKADNMHPEKYFGKCNIRRE